MHAEEELVSCDNQQALVVIYVDAACKMSPGKADIMTGR